MISGDSVTQWLGQIQAGDQAAAQQLWQRYFGRLVALARKKLKGRPLAAADEEDLALGALDSFCRGAAEGRFPRLDDRDDLWRLLVVLTARKTNHAVRDQQRLKRGGGLPAEGDKSFAGDLEQVVGHEPDPAFAALVAEECGRRLASLRDPELERIALWKMEGFTNDEIAARLGCAPRTVERKLRLIRSAWQRQDQQEATR